jgi:hypothetical protein
MRLITAVRTFLHKTFRMDATSLGQLQEGRFAFQCIELSREHSKKAAQGYGQALMWMGRHCEAGLSVAADKAEAIRWYKRASASGHPHAAESLMRLGA